MAMENFSIAEMQRMQIELQEKYREKWEPICPEVGLKRSHRTKFERNMKRWQSRL